MGDSKKRKVHTPEFKAKVGLEALRGVKTLNELGQNYGVHPVQIGLWKKEIQEQAKTLFEGRRGPKPVIAAHREPELRLGHFRQITSRTFVKTIEWVPTNKTALDYVP